MGIYRNLGIICRNRIEGRVRTEHAHLQGLVHGALLDKAASLELLFTTACDLLVLCHGSTVASEAVDCRIDVAADRLANALHVSSDEASQIEYMQETYMTLGEHALQALPSLGTHVAAGRSRCGVCACGMVGTRGVGAGEVVCRHDGYVDVNVIVGIECCDESR
jgi:hypothetical protein